MPFARWETFEACTLEMMETGHDKESAEKICGSIKERAEKGELYKAEQTELDIISKGEDGKDLIVGGYASWELIDPQRDIITAQAQSQFLKQFFQQEPEYQNITVNHKEFKIGKPLLKYVDSQGKEYFSHVNEKGMYLISKIRNDKLKTTQLYRAKILKGEMGMYSISGLPLEYQMVKAEDGMEVRRVDDVEPWAVTLCEKGVTQAVNPKAVASVISKNVEIKKQIHKTPREIMDENFKNPQMDFMTRFEIEKKNRAP